jgi:hypothetical protein
VVRIITVPDLDIAVSALVAAWKEGGRPTPIRLEGFCGTGKTTIAHGLTTEISAAHVEGDYHVDKFDEPPPYPQCIRQPEFDEVIEALRVLNRPLVLDAVCLEEIAPSAKWGRGLVVYIKRLSFNNSLAPIWHAGLNLTGRAPPDHPELSVHEYHLRFRPHETADLIIEVPEYGHVLPEGAFSRDMCLDLPGAELGQ